VKRAAQAGFSLVELMLAPDECGRAAAGTSCPGAVVKRTAHTGLGLVELMLALLIGALVVAAAIGIFVGNRQTMATAQGIGQMQQNLSVALDLLARDLRRAGGNPCGRHLPLANVINSPAARWWTDWPSAPTDSAWRAPAVLRGVAAGELGSGSGAGAPVAGSDAIQVLAADAPVATVTSHDGARFVLNTSAHGFASGNLLMACDPRQASVFQATVSGRNVTHPAGGTPGNCSAHLGLPGGCGAPPFSYAPNALLARVHAARWYLGHNGRGGTSLYRVDVGGNGQAATREEMVEHVSTLNFRYLLAGNAGDVDSAGVAGRWSDVTAVRILLSVSAPQVLDDDGAPLTRSAAMTVSLRNRNP